MPSKYYQRNFQPNHYYHVYNRGVAKQNIYLDSEDYQTFLDIIVYYLQHPTKNKFSLKERSDLSKDPIFKHEVSFRINAFCLMPNHFHLLIYQKDDSTTETAIPNFIRRVSIAYAMYFNTKYLRTGTLLEKYKNVLVETTEQLLHLTKYIHRNPCPGNLFTSVNLTEYPYSSYTFYLGLNTIRWLSVPIALTPLNVKKYKKFTEENSGITNNIENILIE